MLRRVRNCQRYYYYYYYILRCSVVVSKPLPSEPVLPFEAAPADGIVTNSDDMGGGVV